MVWAASTEILLNQGIDSARTGSDREEGFIDPIDFDIVDLVDSHNVAVPANQRHHPQQRTWQETPVDKLQTPGYSTFNLS